MFRFFLSLNPVMQSLLAGMFTFGVTTLGSSVVFFFKSIHKTVLDSMLSFSAGIMLSASFFSLLEPAIELSDVLDFPTWLVVFIGFFSGGILLYLGDRFLLMLDKKKDSSFSSFRRSIMLFSSITLHNIPEGMVLGVAFASVSYEIGNTSIFSAIALTIGIAVQNFPEGSAISLPLRRENISRCRAFLFGSFSGIVEPIAAILGALLVVKIQFFLPFILSFTAGAMIFVITKELIPESQTNQKQGMMTLSVMFGFSIMMILELLLG